MMDTSDSPSSASASESSALADASGWLTHFIETRQSVVLACLITLAAALVLQVISGWLLSRYSRRMDREGFQWTGILGSSLGAPLGFAIWAVAATMVARMLIVPDPDQAGAELLTQRIGQVRLGLIIFLLGWFVVRTVRRVEGKLAIKAKTSDRLDLTAVHAIANFTVVLTWLLVLLIAAQSYGLNMTAIVTLGGASAFALSFAFQDVFKNLFGGIMILVSRPFRVGDAITLSGKGISGSVERIGIYQTVMRNWDKVPVFIPNSLFLTDPILNLSGISHRKISFVIGLRYQDMTEVRSVTEEIEASLRAHAAVDSDGLLRVVFDNYGGSSLDITVTCMSLAGASPDEAARLKQELMLLVGAIVSRHGADFAFPTQTLDLPAPIDITSASP